MKLRPLTGTITALVTPFREGQVDYADLKRLVAYQIKGGIDGLVPVGTTGESPTLDHEEHLDVIRAVIAAAAGRVPVIAGTGSNSTLEAVHLTKLSHEAGADAMLVVAPYYNKPSQEGLFRHFATIADATDRPIILYSIPGRCGIEISVSVVERLRAKFKHVRWIKEAGGSVDRVDQLKQAMGRDITVLSGDDSLTLPFMAVGAEGVISVASNLFARRFPRWFVSRSLKITPRPASTTGAFIRFSSHSSSNPIRSRSSSLWPAPGSSGPRTSARPCAK
jgi:4-hydroxy-tetrahydrodipicolinate synthase